MQSECGAGAERVGCSGEQPGAAGCSGVWVGWCSVGWGGAAFLLRGLLGIRLGEVAQRHGGEGCGEPWLLERAPAHPTRVGAEAGSDCPGRRRNEVRAGHCLVVSGAKLAAVAQVWGFLPRSRDLGVQGPVRFTRRAAAPPHVAQCTAAARNGVGLVPVVHGVEPWHVLVHEGARAPAKRPYAPDAGGRRQHLVAVRVKQQAGC